MAMTWQAVTRSSRRLVAAFVLVIGLSALTTWLVRAIIAGSAADPGGRILNTLRATEGALPQDARVLYRYELEPKWDSCDGRPGTFGWDNIMVQIHFDSQSSSDAVVQRADRALRRLGWNPDYVNNQPTFIQVGWTRHLDNGSVAKAQLSDGVPDQSAATPRWDLFVAAPPVGPQVSGC
jgi:hypothetical protein